MRFAPLLLALSVALSGCVINLEPPGPVYVIEESVELPPIPAPDSRTPPPGAANQNAPIWSTGERWNYTILDLATGKERGYAQYEMLGALNLSGTIAYEVREFLLLHPDHERPAGAPPEDVSARTVYYDLRTLDLVWHSCSGEWNSTGPCTGRVPEMNFPLWDGKTWTAMCCGDTPVNQTWNASLQADGTWRIERTDEFCGADPACRDWAVYDPEARHVVEAKKGDTRWELQRS